MPQQPAVSQGSNVSEGEEQKGAWERERCWKWRWEQQYGFESQPMLRELELIQEVCKNDNIQLKRESGS